jgi:hypothetical protein
LAKTGLPNLSDNLLGQNSNVKQVNPLSHNLGNTAFKSKILIFMFMNNFMINLLILGAPSQSDTL